MDNTAQKSLPLSGQTFLFSTVECGKHMEALHKARLTALPQSACKLDAVFPYLRWETVAGSVSASRRNRNVIHQRAAIATRI